ncbi:MAG TPA: serine hydrolase domain-containing protein [Thermoanaerobaculia bacterium]|nr:serine hydrolase domain-containing protein [Thermoanaerobaculia bacterium]
MPRLAAGIVALVALATPASAATKLAPSEIPAAVDAILAEAMARPGAAGMQVAVALGDDLVVEKGYGLAEVELRVPVSVESVFRIGSVTKQFTAAAVMKLVEEGRIELDAPFAKYYPDFPTAEHTVTVRHLLTHTSGIKSYTGLGPKWRRTVPLELTHDELLDLVRDEPFDFAPEERFLYNNTGYYLLGVLIEKVSGKPYDQYLREDLLLGLYLPRTRYGSNHQIIEGRAEGYRLVDGELQNDEAIGMSQPGAAGALVSTASELVRWQRALVAGKVVSAESYRQMTTPHVLADGKATGYGFGLAVSALGEHRRVGHGGGINGFNSMLAYYPDGELSVAVLSNSEAIGSGKVAEAIARAVLGVETKVEDLEVSAAEIARLAGTYHLEGTPLDMRVWGEGERMFTQATGQGESRLLSQGNGEFRADFDNEVRLAFEPGAPAPAFTLYQGGAQVRAVRKEAP